MNETIVRTLRGQVCISCGMLFGIDSVYDDELRRTHEGFYCPSGHQQYYSGKSDLEIAREQRDQAIRDRERTKNDLASALHKINSERAAKSRLRNRVAKGICPCCHRTFENLARHMKSKHPNVAK